MDPDVKPNSNDTSSKDPFENLILYEKQVSSCTAFLSPVWLLPFNRLEFVKCSVFVQLIWWWRFENGFIPNMKYISHVIKVTLMDF